jgi:hypothetical protein
VQRHGRASVELGAIVVETGTMRRRRRRRTTTTTMETTRTTTRKMTRPIAAMLPSEWRPRLQLQGIVAEQRAARAKGRTTPGPSKRR